MEMEYERATQQLLYKLRKVQQAISVKHKLQTYYIRDLILSKCSNLLSLVLLQDTYLLTRPLPYWLSHEVVAHPMYQSYSMH